jgi:phenylalanyl-tRNA synthetase beta subunit
LHLDISATANRSDSLSIQGISTEIAALLNKPIKISTYSIKFENWKQTILKNTRILPKKKIVQHLFQ